MVSLLYLHGERILSVSGSAGSIRVRAEILSALPSALGPHRGPFSKQGGTDPH